MKEMPLVKHLGWHTSKVVVYGVYKIRRTKTRLPITTHMNWTIRGKLVQIPQSPLHMQNQSFQLFQKRHVTPQGQQYQPISQKAQMILRVDIISCKVLLANFVMFFLVLKFLDIYL